MFLRTTASLLVAATSSTMLSAAGVGEIVRIATPTTPRCINAKTDELTLTLRRIITQKKDAFLTSDKKAGVTVIATLNSDGNPTAKHPSVNLVDVETAEKGQVRLPLEYPIASLLALSPDSGKTYTKNILLDIYLNKTRGKNTFGRVLDIAGSILAKLPIPANPYSNAANEILKFANDTVTTESKDVGGQLFASVTLQFNNKDASDPKNCGDFQSTGAIAVIGAAGSQDTSPLPLGNLSKKYCWRYLSTNTYEVQYALKPESGCDKLADSAFNEVPNDYVMIVVSAAAIAKPPDDPGHEYTKQARPERLDDLQESMKLCGAMKLPPILCGVQ